MLITIRVAIRVFVVQKCLMFRVDLLLLNVSIALGGILPPEEVKERFDSNCITPVSDLALNQQLSVSG